MSNPHANCLYTQFARRQLVLGLYSYIAMEIGSWLHLQLQPLLPEKEVGYRSLRYYFISGIVRVPPVSCIL